MLAADPGLREQLEGVAIHPYGRTPRRSRGSVRAARAELDALGVGNVEL